MKRMMSGLLALMLAVIMGATGFAAPKATPGVDFVGKDGDLVDYKDFLSVDSPNQTLMPGQTYYFDCKWLSGPMDAEFFDFYDTSVSVRSYYEKGDDEYISSTAVSSRISEADFAKGGDGNYYFKFQAKNSYSYVEDLPLTVVVISKSKTDPDYRCWTEFDIDIGYSQTGNGAVAVNQDEYDVNNSEPIVEFDSSLSQCKLVFEDESYYSAYVASRKGKKVNLLSTKDSDAVIASSNPTATLKFLNFPAKPSFEKAGVLKIYAPNMTHLYSIDSKGALTLLSTTNNSGYFGLTTAELGNYVASNKALTAQNQTVPPQGGAVVTPPPTHINPGTGANA